MEDAGKVESRMVVAGWTGQADGARGRDRRVRDEAGTGRGRVGRRTRREKGRWDWTVRLVIRKRRYWVLLILCW